MWLPLESEAPFLTEGTLECSIFRRYSKKNSPILHLRYSLDLFLRVLEAFLNLERHSKYLKHSRVAKQAHSITRNQYDTNVGYLLKSLVLSLVAEAPFFDSTSVDTISLPSRIIHFEYIKPCIHGFTDGQYRSITHQNHPRSPLQDLLVVITTQMQNEHYEIHSYCS